MTVYSVYQLEEIASFMSILKSEKMYAEFQLCLASLSKQALLLKLPSGTSDNNPCSERTNVVLTNQMCLVSDNWSHAETRDQLQQLSGSLVNSYGLAEKRRSLLKLDFVGLLEHEKNLGVGMSWNINNIFVRCSVSSVPEITALDTVGRSTLRCRIFQ